MRHVRRVATTVPKAQQQGIESVRRPVTAESGRSSAHDAHGAIIAISVRYVPDSTVLKPKLLSLVKEGDRGVEEEGGRSSSQSRFGGIKLIGVVVASCSREEIRLAPPVLQHALQLLDMADVVFKFNAFRELRGTSFPVYEIGQDSVKPSSTPLVAPFVRRRVSTESVVFQC